MPEVSMPPSRFPRWLQRALCFIGRHHFDLYDWYTASASGSYLHCRRCKVDRAL